MVKAFKLITIAAVASTLSACVTQNYENSKTPVVQNDSSTTEIAMTRISLGLGYLKMGNTTQAKLNLEKAKRFAPNLVQVYTAFAHYYETVGEDELTIASYEKALSLKPDDADTLNNYGVFLCRKDRLPEAEVQFLRAIAVPSYLLVSQSYQNLALCQLKAPNFEKAEQYLAKAIDHNPSSAANLFQMMRLLYAEGRYQEALAYSKRFEKATRRFNPDSLSLSYKIYQKLGDEKVAKNYGSMLVNMFPESWHAKQYLLNDLEKIEADELAEKYQLLKLGAYGKPETKRVVKLTPTDKPAVSIARTRAKPKTPDVVNKKRVVQLSPPESLATAEPQAEKKKTVVLKAPDAQINESTAQAQTEAANVNDKVSQQDIVKSTAAEPALTEKANDAETQLVHTSSEVVAQVQEAMPLTNETEDSDALIEQSEENAESAIVSNASNDELAAEQASNNNQMELINDDEVTTIDGEQDALAAIDDAIAAVENALEVAEQEGDELDQEFSSVIATTEQDELLVNEIIESTSEGDLQDSSGQDSSAQGATAELAAGEDSDTLSEVQTLSEEPLEQPEVTINDSLAGSEDNEPDTLSEEAEAALEDEALEPTYKSLAELPQHIIEKGENLFTVSKKYNIHLRSLKKWNGLDERALVRIGDVIYLVDPAVVTEQEEQ